MTLETLGVLLLLAPHSFLFLFFLACFLACKQTLHGPQAHFSLFPSSSNNPILLPQPTGYFQTKTQKQRILETWKEADPPRSRTELCSWVILGAYYLVFTTPYDATHWRAFRSDTPSTSLSLTRPAYLWRIQLVGTLVWV